MVIKRILFLASLLSSMHSFASDDLRKKTEEALTRTLGNDAIVSKADSMADGEIIEVMMIDGSILHMLPSMKHIVYRGSVYSLGSDGLKNISAEKMNPIRKESMAAIKDSETIIFPAEGIEKTKINIFTDIDCSFCQKIHKEVPDLNKLGITVRYLSFPRAGIIDVQTKGKTESFKKLAYAWCQNKDEEKRNALTWLKATQQELGVIAREPNPTANPRFNAVVKSVGDVLKKDLSDCNAPIEMQYNIGKQLGVTGTPAIVTESGEIIAGYMKAADLAKRLGIN